MRKSLAAAAGLVPLAMVSIFGLRIFLRERSYLHPPHGALQVPIERAGLPELSEVRFPSKDRTLLSGWYVPPKTPKVVILLHGTEGDRSTLLDEIAILKDAGIGALAFDFPGHGLSEGQVKWGEPERDAVIAAVDFVAEKAGAGVQIGALGFSYGGYVLAQVAGSEPRLAAVALVGAPADATEIVRWEYRKWGPVAGWLALRFDDWLGYAPDDHKARDLVGKIAPRPLLILSGGGDTVVPPFMVKELFEHAREPKRLVILDRARHGDYAKAEPSAYREHLTQFFSQMGEPSKTSKDL